MRASSKSGLCANGEQQIAGHWGQEYPVGRGDPQSPENPEDRRRHHLPASRADQLLTRTGHDGTLSGVSADRTHPPPKAPRSPATAPPADSAGLVRC